MRSKRSHKLLTKSRLYRDQIQSIRLQMDEIDSTPALDNDLDADNKYEALEELEKQTIRSCKAWRSQNGLSNEYFNK